MKRIPFIKSLMSFDKRVLCQGTPVAGVNYGMEDLKNLLFFNSVFIGNTDEIFERRNPMLIMDEYVSSLNRYIQNISIIIQQSMSIRREVKFTREDSFERRFAMETHVDGNVMTQYYSSVNDVRYKFKSGEIYYLSMLPRDYVAISYVDSSRELYKEPLCCAYKDHILYWKTDDCIRDYIKKDLSAVGTVAVKVTTSQKNPNIITKVEYNGNTEIMRKLATIFGRKALMISNPFIFVGDIEQMISANGVKSKVEERPTFKAIKALDILEEDELIEYPVDSFDDYLQFLKSATVHPETKEIYLTLYRIGTNPAIFYILRDAVNRGIYVHVNIELYASGEKINKVWMDEMLEAGIDVTTYAAGELKVHAKLTLVKFNNGKSIAQIGTGNYHTKTTSQYTDLSLMTSDESICYQVEKIFNMFRDHQEEESFNSDILVTRYNARERLIDLIDREADKGDNGYICIKCNALDDDEIISHLDKAAASGCNMNLIIRGVCTWIPDEIGDTVQIKSIVWDKLEHSRVYAFGRENPTIYIGSLDIVTNKLDKRIETLVRINDPNILIRICDYLNRYITNTRGSWVMCKNGSYVKE